ncbi:MAG: hypothetical protein VW867_09540 [Gammaproteobacteria bacterium]
MLNVYAARRRVSGFWMSCGLMLCLLSNPVLANDTTTVSFVRSTDLMTLTQVVQLTLGADKLGKLGQSKIIVVEVPKGKYKVETKVGLSLGVPNITGFNGAKKFKGKVNLNQDAHYFKVVFKAALMGGRHHVIEVSKAEFDELAAKANTVDAA